MEKIINELYNQVVTMNGGEGHVVLGEIKNDPEATAVISVYYGQKPSHTILDELYAWAENNELKDILTKIEELSSIE